MFVSDGRPTDKDTAQQSKEEILRVISQQNTLLRNEVIIQTFGIGDGTDHDPSSTQYFDIFPLEGTTLCNEFLQ